MEQLGGGCMKYKSFRIQNFKGIKDTTVELQGLGNANVFAFVGLNESGKTTVLEAIHSFAPDRATSELLGGEEGLGVPIKERVPRHLISEFTGEVSVTATVLASEIDKQAIAKDLLDNREIILNVKDLPNEIVLRRHQRFVGGDFKGAFFSIDTDLQVKGKKQIKWRAPTVEERAAIRNAIFNRTPLIAYFPTFVFDFPNEIFLTERGGVVDRFYRRVFQDILDFDGRNITIEKDLIGRLRREGLIVPWLAFFAAWNEDDARNKIQHVMDRAGAVVTKLVFGRWNKIFGEDTRGKEVVISYEPVEGGHYDDNEVWVKSNEHDLKIKFQIRDGTRRFDVNDRSLGFRWFFSFMLFTQFRVARSGGGRPLLFLFDEPASNLHAAAQQKLIDSFPEVAKNEHVLAYSTHSHYMIEPKWLEQTFIVTNRADDPLSSVLDAVSLDDESLDVRVSTYRAFVNSHPSQTSYFQPILDRLEVVPSRLDAKNSSVVVEGKSDYYILRYAEVLLDTKELPLLPGLGAGTFGALAALDVGWGKNFLYLLDGDSQGKKEKRRYVLEYGVRECRVLTLDELDTGLRVIEDLLGAKAREVIASRLKHDRDLSKSQISRFFQECLASGKVESLGDDFEARARKILSELKRRLDLAD